MTCKLLDDLDRKTLRPVRDRRPSQIMKRTGRYPRTTADDAEISGEIVHYLRPAVPLTRRLSPLDLFEPRRQEEDVCRAFFRFGLQICQQLS